MNESAYFFRPINNCAFFHTLKSATKNTPQRMLSTSFPISSLAMDTLNARWMNPLAFVLPQNTFCGTYNFVPILG